MNARTRGRLTEIQGQINQLGRLSAGNSLGKQRVAPLPTHHDQPRASSLLNDNYCVTKLQARLLAGEPHNKTDIRHFLKCKLACCTICSYCARTFPKERSNFRVSRLLLQRKQIKICEKCFLCHSNVLCKTCNKCQKCCLKSACRGQTSKLLANLAGSRCRSESGSNPERGLHPPLSEPAKTHKVSHSHKLLCQSPQEQLPAGGITLANRQKCSGTSTKPNISGFFQPAFFGPKAQQQVATYIRSEQTESFPQGGEIQNGDTGNHQDIPLTRGVGLLNRFQGRLLPYTNTGTVQEISEISCPRSDIPVQSSAFRFVHSTLGVHCSSKGGETYSHTQGYKDPPVHRATVELRLGALTDVQPHQSCSVLGYSSSWHCLQWHWPTGMIGSAPEHLTHHVLL